MTALELLPSLDAVRERGPGRWSARCPAHADRTPSLSLSEGDKGILLKCWAGCTVEQIASALGLRVSDLFMDALPLPATRQQVKAPIRLNRRTLAFRFVLCALDLRLRSERILMAVQRVDYAGLNDSECDRLMLAIASAYQDIDRATVLEHVADTLYWRAFQERTMPHAA